MSECWSWFRSTCYCCFSDNGDEEYEPLLGSQRRDHGRESAYRIERSRGFEDVKEIEGAPTEKKWYHGGISDREAENRLVSSHPSVEDGTYLVYDNPSRRGEYVLLVYCQRRVLKWRIIRRQSDGQYVLGEDGAGVPGYKSVSKLIKRHRGITGKHIKLQHGGTVRLMNYVYVA